MKTSETGCYLVALLFLDFLCSKNDSFLDKIAPQHINVLKSLSEKKPAVVGLVVCFTLATCIEANGCATGSWPVYSLSIAQSRNTGSVSPCQWYLSGTFPVKLYWRLNCCL